MGGRSSGQEDGPSIYMPYGASGGGGAGGQYVFTNLDELNTIITELETLRDGIQFDGVAISRARDLAAAPAEDVMSVGQVSAYRAALEKARHHNDAMVAYANDQIAKLRAARDTYAGSDADASAELHSAREAD